MIRVNPREKRILFTGGGVVGALLIYLLVVSPYMSAMELWDRRITRKTQELSEVLALQQEYLGLKEKTKVLEDVIRSTRGFSLLSFLENLATKNKIKTKIAYMKPLTTPTSEKFKESSVEMKLEGLNLQELVDFLYQVELSAQPIRIKRLNIAKKKGNAYLDMTLQASTFEPLGRGKGPEKGRTRTLRTGTRKTLQSGHFSDLWSKRFTILGI
jgi:general secretion pathway protein M